MKNLSLYILCVAIWGSTYFAIRYQVIHLSPAQGVFFRFLLSSAILWAFVWFRPGRWNLRVLDHGLIAGQGFFMFCLNYVLTYHSENHLPSGLVALIFMSMVLFNILGMRFLFKKPIHSRVWLGSALGFIGLLLVFGPELFKGPLSTPTWFLGMTLALLGSLSASIGNMFSHSTSSRGIPILASLTLGTTYGWIFCFLWILVRGETLSFPNQWDFVLSLVYLSVFGTLIAFGAYLTLLKNIGAEKAVYSTVLTPVLAVILSILFEGLNWNLLLVLGVALCLLGNFVTLATPGRTRVSG